VKLKLGREKLVPKRERPLPDDEEEKVNNTMFGTRKATATSTSPEMRRRT
jgi:hypothetical protein